MRRLFVWLALTAIVGFQADTASAWTKKLNATRGQVASACAGVKDGLCANCTGTSGSYSCDNPNNGCHIECDGKGNCTGGCPGKAPARLASVGVRGMLTGGQLAQPDTPSTRPSRPGTGASSQGPLGGGLLDGGGQGLGPRGPAATGAPLSTGGAPAAPSAPTIR